MDNSRNILVCVDDSENSHRAVHYVGNFLGGAPGYRITLLSIVEDPPMDFFKDDADRSQYIAGKQEAMQRSLGKAREALLEYGFPEESIQMKIYVRACPSMGQCILNHQSQENFGTVVVGRRGISKSEEFLFGSISNTIIHYARNCTVWVVN